MKAGYSPGALFKPFTTSVFTYPKATRLVLTVIIVLMVISSPIFMLTNPADVLASTTINTNKVDRSSYYTSSQASERSLPVLSSSTPIPIGPSTISQDGGGDFTTQAALGSLTARPTNNIVNTNSFYDVVFLAASTGAIKTIQVTFPAGTTIPSGAFFNEAEGIGPGTASKSGQTITYTVTNAVNVPAGTKIRLEFANINNPLNPSSAYQVTVTTRDAANAIIDGPSQSTAYTIKQIGVNAIADGSITSTKPAESFMKRVTVTDSAAGNAVGWTPDGVDTFFTISESGMFGVHTAFFTLEVGNTICAVVAHSASTGSFQIRCTVPPSDGATLHYVVGNLPSHVVT